MLEIERKFLVKPSALDNATKAYELTQGYISKNDNGSIRIRIEAPLIEMTWWNKLRYLFLPLFFPLPKAKAYLMSKIRVEGSDMSNHETVDEISIDNAITLLTVFANKTIKKTRYIQYLNEKKWEIDVFEKPNNGLMLAEIELESENEEIFLPEWIEREVTGEPQYYNANM